MKKLLTLLLITAPVITAAQEWQGKITYNRKQQRELPKEVAARQTKVVEGITETNMDVELMFNKSKSLYRARPLPEDQRYHEGDFESGRFSSSELENAELLIMKTRHVDNHHKVYRDLEKQDIIIKRVFRKKDFLLTAAPESGKWKLTNEKKEITGYKCNKATRIDGDQIVEAWYTTKIPVASGPSVYGDLPGLILEVNIDNGKLLYVARITDVGPDFSDAIIAPSKGKKVTPGQFDKIVRIKKAELKELRTRDSDNEERESAERGRREH